MMHAHPAPICSGPQRGNQALLGYISRDMKAQFDEMVDRISTPTLRSTQEPQRYINARGLWRIPNEHVDDGP